MNEPTTQADCGCTPTDAQNTAAPRRITRRNALAIGALGVAAVGVFASGAGGLLIPAAYADDYPSWDDVQNAMNNESAKAGEISRIQGLIDSLAQNVAQTKAASEAAGQEFFTAQQAYFDQAARATALQTQADTQAALATDSAKKAAQVAAQLYRDGGDSTSMQLFFSGSAATADEMLQKLGQMDRLLANNQAVYDKAIAARNSAQSLSDQAKDARDARDKLQKVAEDKMKKAQDAAAAADAALKAQQDNLVTLQAQLAALQDATAKTTASYQAGVAERQRQEEARRAQEEADRIAREQNNNNGGGNTGGGNTGGGNTGGGSVGADGWVRPHGGFQSSGYGPRVPDCDSWGCSSSFHYGVDLANGCGAPIYAAHDGVVVYAGWNGGYGNYIRLDNGGGIGTGYAHIVSGGFNVSYGDWVSAGQVIAYAGNTGGSFGCHLHFEVYQGSNGAINPIVFMENRGIDMS